LSKYKDDTSDELLSHLKREFTVSEVNFEWKDEPFKFIKIEDKMRPLADNKKYLVNKIFSIVEDDWISLGEKKIRRTIKKYLDGIK
jgi:hypothetical protein